MPFIDGRWIDHADADTCVPGDPDPTFRCTRREEWLEGGEPHPVLCAAIIAPPMQGGLDLLSDNDGSQMSGLIASAITCTRTYGHTGQHVATTGLSDIDPKFESRVVAVWTLNLDSGISLPEEKVMADVREKLSDAFRPIAEALAKAHGMCGQVVRRLSLTGSDAGKTWTCTESVDHTGVHRAEWSDGSLAASWNPIEPDSLEPLGLTEFDAHGAVRTKM